MNIGIHSSFSSTESKRYCNSQEVTAVNAVISGIAQEIMIVKNAAEIAFYLMKDFATNQIYHIKSKISSH